MTRSTRRASVLDVLGVVGVLGGGEVRAAVRAEADRGVHERYAARYRQRPRPLR